MNTAALNVRNVKFLKTNVRLSFGLFKFDILLKEYKLKVWKNKSMNGHLEWSK